jgi:uncharacterized Zn finger protein
MAPPTYTEADTPENVKERPPLAELLAGLDRDQLQALLLKLADHDPALVATIEAHVPLLASPSTSAPGPQAAQSRPSARLPPVDPKELRRQVRSLIGIGGSRRSWRSYANVGSAAASISEALAQAQKRVDAGDGRGALIMLDVITDEFMSVYEELDDSDGESIDFFADLGSIWTEALLTGDLDAQERRAWIPKLEAWHEEVDDYGIDEAFKPALLAAAQGWEYPPLQRVLRGEITEKGAWDGEAPLGADELAEARLKVLDRQGRHQEYLYLAEAESQTDRYVTMLARLGRGAEALEYGRAHLRTTRQALDLATAFWERGDVEQALESAEAGLTMEGHKGALATWLRDRAAEQGQTARALAAARAAFEAEQGLASYLKIRELAGSGWPAEQGPLLDRLRATRSYYPQGPVEVFLHEGLIEDAIAAVDRGATHTLVEQVADAAISTHPDWVITVSRKQAEGLMDDGKAQYYGSAARWLARARDAYRATGRHQEWNTYLASLLERHRRKYTLVPLLEGLTR